MVDPGAHAAVEEKTRALLFVALPAVEVMQRVLQKGGEKRQELFLNHYLAYIDL